MPECRVLMIPIRDLRLVLSEPAGRWLLAMLAAFMAPESESGRLRGRTADWTLPSVASQRLPVRIQAVAYVCHPGELGRPRWEGSELAIATGGLVVRFSEMAVRRLLAVLAGFLAAEPGAEREASRATEAEPG